MWNIVFWRQKRRLKQGYHDLILVFFFLPTRRAKSNPNHWLVLAWDLSVIKTEAGLAAISGVSARSSFVLGAESDLEGRYPWSWKETKTLCKKPEEKENGGKTYRWRRSASSRPMWPKIPCRIWNLLLPRRLPRWWCLHARWGWSSRPSCRSFLSTRIPKEKKVKITPFRVFHEMLVPLPPRQVQ